MGSLKGGKAMEKGDIVKIYHDPITRLDLDGAAELLKQIPFPHPGFEQWKVRYVADGMVTYKLIATKS